MSAGEGWWQRNDRYSHGNQNSRLLKIKNNVVAPILIIGKRGTLGNAFKKICRKTSPALSSLKRGKCDITNAASINTALALYKPWAVINAAGYVKVDDAEKEAASCFSINTDGAALLAIACKKTGIKLVSLSRICI